MNKNKKSLVLLVALLVVTVGAYFVSGTYAKYTSSASGSATATVAKWSFKVGDTEIANATAQNITFNLFSTVNEADTTSTEGDVDSGKIAPGTGGSFAINVQNTSEVTAKYAIDYTVTNTSSIPVEFSVDGGTNWTTTLTDVTASDSTKLDSGATSSTEAAKVLWRWAFEGSSSENYTSSQTDATDTALGIAAQTTAPTIEVSVSVTATQVD